MNELRKGTEVLTVYVDITAFSGVKGVTGEALMIHFGGRTESEFFTGTILPGGVDTQQQPINGARTLSARYVLEGKDYKGEPCKIFVENNGGFEADGSIRTTPHVYTDSAALAFLETTPLYGTISPKENGVIIHICLDADAEQTR